MFTQAQHCPFHQIPHLLVLWKSQLSSKDSSSHYLLDSHSTSTEQDVFATLQLHLAVEHASLLHLIMWRTSSGTTATSGGRVIGSRLLLWDLFHPYCKGLMIGGSGLSTHLQMAAWKWALQMCCSKASLVGESTLSSGAEFSLWFGIFFQPDYVAKGCHVWFIVVTIAWWNKVNW